MGETIGYLDVVGGTCFCLKGVWKSIFIQPLYILFFSYFPNYAFGLPPSSTFYVIVFYLDKGIKSGRQLIESFYALFCAS